MKTLNLACFGFVLALSTMCISPVAQAQNVAPSISHVLPLSELPYGTIIRFNKPVSLQTFVGQVPYQGFLNGESRRTTSRQPHLQHGRVYFNFFIH